MRMLNDNENACRDYKAIAEEVLKGSGATTNTGNRYRSDAVQLEVKLSEALSHARKGMGTEQGPNTVGTAVCLCLLSEIAGKKGPFKPVLLRIKDELERAIYSDEFNAGDGTQWLDQVGDQAGIAYNSPSLFARRNSCLCIKLINEQAPYFALVKKLREENFRLSKEVKNWHRELTATRGEVQKIGYKIQELECRVADKDSSIAELKDTINRAKLREERYLAIIKGQEFEQGEIVNEVDTSP